VEKSFPRCGKSKATFSTLWKIGAVFFHAVENFFPCCGKVEAIFSMLWNIREIRFDGKMLQFTG